MCLYGECSLLMLVNGESVGPINLNRDFRQGDTLSPYIFMMCAYEHFALLKRVKAKREIHGIKVCQGAPLLTHLLFTNNYFLLCRGR